MQRRRFLASTALLGASAVAGCNATGSETPPRPPDAPTGVVDVSFTSGVEDVDVGREQPPRVTCDTGTGQVRVVGAAPSGNNCSSLYLERLAYEDGELSLAVAGWEPNRDCGEVLRVPGYEAVVEMVDDLPERVRATEPSTGESDTRTTTSEC
jgi:hypothetical protein